MFALARGGLLSLSPSLLAGIPGSRTLRSPASSLRFAALTLIPCRLRCTPGYPARGRSGLRRARSASLHSPSSLVAFAARRDTRLADAQDSGELAPLRCTHPHRLSPSR